MSIFAIQFLAGILFLSTIFLHLTKKNFGAVTAYSVQSFAITLLLLNSFFETKSFHLLLVVLVTLLIKVIFAPTFFTKLIKKYQLTFSISTQLNTPLTLLTIVAFSAMAHSTMLSPLTAIIPEHETLLSLALSAIFLSFFLIVNHKGALFQIIGVLSLENSIVAFAIYAGLEQSPMLELGIIFDILIWSVIATVFVSMIYRHFGSIDTSVMKHLTD